METEALAQNLEHLCRYWETQSTAAASRETPPPSPRFTIALSREAGAMGTSIARETGKRLGWLVYDDELLAKIAQDMGVRAALLKSVDERSLSWITEVFEASMPTRDTGDWDSPPSESAYAHHLIKTVLALGTHGECVIVGRGAAFILPAETTLRVRLVGKLRERVAAWARACRTFRSEKRLVTYGRWTENESISSRTIF